MMSYLTLNQGLKQFLVIPITLEKRIRKTKTNTRRLVESLVKSNRRIRDTSYTMRKSSV